MYMQHLTSSTTYGINAVYKHKNTAVRTQVSGIDLGVESGAPHDTLYVISGKISANRLPGAKPNLNHI